MCGIAGLAGNFPLGQQEEGIRLACQSLRHRGPDDQRHFIDLGIALGVSRLAIRDPKKGIQPMQWKEMTIAFNGELYDTDSLKERLLKLGHFFETDGDTEILLKAFVEFGPSILPELVGMFAFAIWNSKTKTLYLARDRWGEKPLYYTSGKDFLAFASEIKALQVWPHIQWETHLEDIPIFLKNSYLPNPRTGWENVFKVEPGSFLTWQEGRLTKSRYFSLKVKEEKNAPLKKPEDLFALLDTSVKQCAVSDRPVGAFLSGGLDSTTIAYFLSKYRPDAPVFSLVWDDQSYSEEFYAKEAAQALGLKHFLVKADASFFLHHFDSIVQLYDEPFADESMVPSYCLARFAKQKVDVVLTGDGADEFFHGYERYFFKGDFKEYLNVFAAISDETLQLICHPDFLAAQQESPFLSLDTHLSGERRRSVIDIKTYLTDDILMKVDRACMGASLESRAPFLTPQVTHFALQCPMQQLAGEKSQGKEILRAAMESHLPLLTLKRKKMGFGVPLNHWFRSSLKEWMISRLLDGSLLKTGWFSKQGLQELISNHLENRGNYARAILNLLVLEVWLKKTRPKK